MLAVPPQIILNRVTSSAMTQDFGGCQVWLPHVAESEMSMISHGMVHLAPVSWLHHQALREVLVHTSTSAHRHLPLISPFGLAQVSSAWTCSVAFLLEGGKEGNLQSKEVPYVIFLSLMAVANMWILTVGRIMTCSQGVLLILRDYVCPLFARVNNGIPIIEFWLGFYLWGNST